MRIPTVGMRREIRMSVALTIIGSVYLFGIAAWVSGALFYDVAQRSRWGWYLIAGWITFVGATVVLLQPLLYAIFLITAVFMLLLVWWFTQRPSNDRNWAPDFSRRCRLQVEGDKIVAFNVRNARYRSLTDYDLHYETREYRLSDLHAADVLILYWGSPWMCHPMVIFDFGQDQHLCFSVEVRYRQGQPYDILRAIYRQYELMYVVTDERDAILRRTKHTENQDCYLYRLQIDTHAVEQLFHEYVGTTNRLFDSPRWYNAVTDNCTTSILKQRSEKVDLDVRMFFNGSLDKLLYERGRLDNQLPFEEFKKLSWINDSANLASSDEFHRAIRRHFPGLPIDRHV